MGLLTLPPEIISMICRFLDLNFSRYYNPNRFVNTDFKSLRRTCRALYKHSNFDAGVRYNRLLKLVMIDFTHLGLCQLLHLASIPEFRDRIQRIAVFVPERNRKEWIDWGAKNALEEEESENYIQSSEAVYLFSECLHRMKQAKSLTAIGLYDSAIHHPTLEALSCTQFPRQIAVFCVEPKQFHGNGHRALEPPNTFLPYIKGLVFEAPELMFEQKSTLQRVYQTKANNDLGYHFSDYSLNHPKLTEFLSTLTSIDYLSLHGAHKPQSLRFCNACHDLFALNIATIHYSTLTKLEILHMYISGSRLRRFIKNHAATLVIVYFNFVNLTDGSWKSIAQGLLKLPELSTLCLGFYLCQKKHTPQTDSSSAFPRIDDHTKDLHVPRRLKGCINIKRFLSTFIEHFQTHKYVSVSGRKSRFPTWYQVTHLKFPGIVEKRQPFFAYGCYEALLIYAKDVL